MNVSYTVRFRDVPPKFKAALDKMLHDEIAMFPKRMRMESATVEEVEERLEAKKRVKKKVKK